ncbi:MAG: hypothetical protein V1881_00130 [Candidatus Micrarchaeota archaeon]
MRNRAIFLVFLLLLSQAAFAQEGEKIKSSAPLQQPPEIGLEVNKTAPQNVSFGKEFEVAIIVFNRRSVPAAISVTEFVSGVEVTSQEVIYPADSGDAGFALLPPHIAWEAVVPANSSRNFTYSAKPLTVGVISIGPTRVSDGDFTYYSNPASIVVACSEEPACDESIGESAMLCPSKCVSKGIAEDEDIEPVESTVMREKPSPTPSPSPSVAAEPEEQLYPSDAAIAGVFAFLAILAYWFFFLRKKR